MVTNPHTIGHKGPPLNGFMEALLRAGVRLAIDVRAKAGGRREW